MTFSEALHGLKQGQRVTRREWKSKGVLEIVHDGVTGTDLINMLLPPESSIDRMVWVVWQRDILADDWIIAFDPPSKPRHPEKVQFDETGVS
jgi:Protein of unknown function (DUF2829)